MSTYNPDVPILFLVGEVTSTTIFSRYKYDDSTGLGPSGSNIGIEFTMTVSNIDTQFVGSNETRTGPTRRYNGLDIKIGDWVADPTGNKCLQITSIESKSPTLITFNAQDVDAYSYKNYRSNQFALGNKICFFEITDSGLPMIAGEDATSFWDDKIGIDKIQTRFELQNNDERFKFTFESPQTQIDLGDICTINSDGNLVKYESAGANSTKVGVVLHKSYGDSIIYIKPYNNIISNYARPQDLTGTLGDIYYASTVSPGDITTISSQGSDKLFMHLKDSIPTTINITIANPALESGATLTLNNETIGTGPLNTDDLVDGVNAKTNIHHVAATTTSPISSTTSQAGSLSAANGDIVFVISSDGGTTFTYPSVTIDDGTNSSTISFETSDSVYPPAPQYITVSASQMADDLNAAFLEDGVNIVASTADSSSTSPPVNNSTTYPLLVLTATSPGFDINITNVNSDVFGQSFQDATAVESVAGSTNKFVTFTRHDGGDILVEGTSSLVNQNGLTSSSSGSPALLLMIEDETGGSLAIGVATDDDLDQIPSETTFDGAATGVFISHTPFADSMVQVTVNGLASNIGDGTTNASCYFSVDGGTTARSMSDIESGDQLYWNGSIAGYELDSGDLIDIIYDKSQT